MFMIFLRFVKILAICQLINFSVLHTGHAATIAGIQIPDSTQIASQKNLVLNGAGIRKKLFLDIYVGALYLEDITSDIDTIIFSNKPKRIALHFVYDEVTAEKLIEGWTDGFRENNSEEQFNKLKSRLIKSYRFFETMYSGDTIFLDLIPGVGTRLTINNEFKGLIEGDDFSQAALKVWIGKKPAQAALKQGMLGI